MHDPTEGGCDTSIGRLIADCSLDMVGRHRAELAAAAAMLPRGTRVHIGAAREESAAVHRATSAAVASLGLIPVPHLAARRIASVQALDHVLRGLQQDGTSDHVLALGGDPAVPEGPFDSALALIRAGGLPGYGVRTVSVGGYPDGHPKIPDGMLWTALTAKLDELAAQGLGAEICTQIVLSVRSALAWIEAVRDRGITVPIRVGVVGPIEPARLVGYARRVGVPADEAVLARYGVVPSSRGERVGPERLVADLAERLKPAVHGDVRLHLFSLGGLRATAEWLAGHER